VKWKPPFRGHSRTLAQARVLGPEAPRRLRYFPTRSAIFAPFGRCLPDFGLWEITWRLATIAVGGLGAERYASERALGATMTREQAVELAQSLVERDV
jgi:hypothetical protein